MSKPTDISIDVYEHIDAYYDYESYVHGDPTLKPWYDFLQNNTQKFEANDTLSLTLTGKLLEHSFKARFNQANLNIPQIEWVQDDGLYRTTGHNFAMPIMIYHADTLETYLNMYGLVQGAYTPINPVMLGLPNGTRPPLIAHVLGEEFDTLLPFNYEARRRHELIHLADPNLGRRQGVESLIHAELIASMGESTVTEFQDYSEIAISPEFILSYLQKSSPQYASIEVAKKISAHASKLTKNRGKNGPNSSIVRNLMLTHENLELRRIITGRSNIEPIITILSERPIE
jgi:hypothetical protein